MLVAIIASRQSENLDVPQATGTAPQSGSIAGGTRRSLGVDTDDPAKKNALLGGLVDEIELDLSIGSGKSAWTNSQVLVIVVSADIPVAVLIAQIRVHVSVEIDELESVLPKPLRPGRNASTGSHERCGTKHRSIARCAKIESVPVVRRSENGRSSVVSVAGKNRVMARGGGLSYPISIEVFFVIDFPSFLDSRSNLFDRQIQVAIHVVLLADAETCFPNLRQYRHGDGHDEREKRHGYEEFHERECGAGKSWSFHAAWLFFLMERATGKDKFQERADAPTGSYRRRKTPIRFRTGSEEEVEYFEQSIFWDVRIFTAKSGEKSANGRDGGLEKILRQSKEDEHGIRFGRSA